MQAISLSDVGLDQTKAIFEAARIKPAVAHVEAHPYHPQWDLLDYCGTASYFKPDSGFFYAREKFIEKAEVLL